MTQHQARGKRGRWWFVGLTAIALAGLTVFQLGRRTEAAPVARGEVLASASGCFACHGRGEPDRKTNSRQMPDGRWRAKAIPTLWENGIDEADVLKDWIANGVPAKEAEEHKRLFIQMPGYREFLTEEEMDSVAAWILAEGVRLMHGEPPEGKVTGEIEATAAQHLPADRVLALGDRLSRQHGCYSCHGELGQGGVKNPASFKGYIPGFFGRDFLALTEDGDREEIAHWIDHGRGRAIESGVTGRWAKRFLDAQAIGMPAYRDRLDATEKAVLVEYVLLLNREGPLSSKQLERIAKVLTEEISP